MNILTIKKERQFRMVGWQLQEITLIIDQPVDVGT
jgi:hypothetical protein